MSDARKGKLLIVKDEFLLAALIRRNIELLGHEVCESVATGEEAIESAEREQPDIVLPAHAAPPTA